MSIREEDIPPEVVEAAAIEMAPHPWRFYTEAAKDHFRNKAHVAILAALAAWPGSDHLAAGEVHDKPVLILPLPQPKETEA